MCQQTHEKLCYRVNKSLAPFLKTIMPYWLLAQSDSYANAAKIAENSFKSTFNEAKQPEVIYFARDEIVNTFQDYLLVQTAKTLSDMKTTSIDEAEQKHETIICMCLRGFELFFKYFFSENSKLFKQPKAMNENSAGASNIPAARECSLTFEKIEKLFGDPKFWKFSKDNSLKTRGVFFQLLYSLIENFILNRNLTSCKSNDSLFLLSIITHLRAKLIPLVFYAIDEDNTTCSYFVWNSVLKLMRNNTDEENVWSMINVKKAFVPKWIALLKSHANGNANTQNVEIVYAAICPLLSSLAIVYNQANEMDEKLTLYKDVLTKLNDSVVNDLNSTVRSTRFGYTTSRAKMVNALFDTSSLILADLVGQSNTKDELFSFCTLFLLNNVRKAYSLF